QERGVEAVFSFPIQQGAARMGALDVYRDRVGSLSPAALKRALTYAEAVMGSLLIADQSEELSPDSLFADSDATFEVYQAQGMVMAQLRVPADVAMARLRAYAFAEERPLGTVAADVLARRIVFTDHDGEQ
ncbi:MAG: hypothetical protein QOK15_400, partial [Nocardioidaceae bacterium]|nr:hypothetical protein [Nocardioidaceae bacterium]